MKNQKPLISAFTVITLLFLSSCKESDTNLLQQAQQCLNKSAASQAEACVTKIAGDVSPIANSLRCSAIFISEGFGSPTAFVTALNSLNTTGTCAGGCSSSLNAMLAFNFTSAGVSNSTQLNANKAKATSAFTYCSQADAKIYSQIASLFKIGTDLSAAAYLASGGGAITVDNLEAQLSSLDNETLGLIVTTTYATACQNTSSASASTVAYCNELNSTLTNHTTNVSIGACLKLKLDNPSAVCP